MHSSAQPLLYKRSETFSSIGVKACMLAQC
jgi:hypothetical protein